MGLLDDAIREHLELKRRRGADATEISRQEHEAFGPPRRGELDLQPAGTAVAEDEPTFEPAQATPPPALHAVEDPDAHDMSFADEGPHIQDEPPRPHGDPADSLGEHLTQATQAFSAEDVRAATTPPPAEPAGDFTAERPRAVPDEPPRPAAASEPPPPPPPPPPAPPAFEPAASTPPAAEPAPPAAAPEPEPEIEPEPALEPEPAAPAAARPDEDEPGPDEEADVLEETPEFLQETPEHDRLWFEQRPPRDFDF
jgi:hypothetical protein